MRRHFSLFCLSAMLSIAGCSGPGAAGAPPASAGAFGRSAKAAPAFRVLHVFRDGKDGAEPYGGLLLDGGVLYGTTAGGGDPNDAGTVYKFAPNGRYSILHRFARKKPFGQRAYPDAGVISGAAGNLYGTTLEAGPLHQGSVYKIGPGGRVTTLHTFTGPEGAFPRSPLVRDTAGNLYGTTEAGGNFNYCEGGGCGTVFKIDTANKLTVLYEFVGGLLDGHDAIGGLARDQQGNLYGTTLSGGGSQCAGEGCGVVFAVDPNGNETILHRFTNSEDGGHPAGTLLLGSDGYLYGTADSGGYKDAGLLFKIDKTGNYGVLYTFSGGSDGGGPFGGLTRDAAGNFYGTTEFGGRKACQLKLGCGTVFELDSSGHETVLYSFKGRRDGAYPLAGVTLDAAGDIYGTTWQAGDRTCDCGVAYVLKP